MSVVGVDGCRSGWVAVSLDQAGRARAHHLLGIEEVTTAVPDAQVVAIDIPIDPPEAGRRPADVEARRFLGRRQSSVFLTPVRSALEAATYSEATAESTRATGTGISRQAFALARKILEVERWLPSARCPVFEVHPEVSFAVLLGSPATPKKTWAGMVQRRDALVRAGIDVDAFEGPATLACAVDDMLDAAVAAWTARRLLDGAGRPFPHPPPRASSGRLVAIWA